MSTIISTHYWSSVIPTFSFVWQCLSHTVHRGTMQCSFYWRGAETIWNIYFLWNVKCMAKSINYDWNLQAALKMSVCECVLFKSTSKKVQLSYKRGKKFISQGLIMDQIMHFGIAKSDWLCASSLQVETREAGLTWELVRVSRCDSCVSTTGVSGRLESWVTWKA